MSYQYSLITGLSGALVSQISAGGGGGIATGISPVLNVTGSFTITGNPSAPFGYSWSGVLGTYGTGTLAAPVSLSGYQMMVKNRCTGAYLLVSGSVDYQMNHTLPPLAAVRLWSDSSTWLVI